MSEKTIFLCNCLSTMSIDGKKIGEVLKKEELPVYTNLCRSELDTIEQAFRAQNSDPNSTDKKLCIGCTQEAALFNEIAAESNSPSPLFFNIREKAGWCKDDKKASPKMAALSALALKEQKPVRSKSIHSDGLCLVIGSGQEALEAATLLNKPLSVSLLLTDASDILLPPSLDFPIFSGTVKRALGTLGSFLVTIENYAALLPSSRADLEFTASRTEANSKCSVIFDLSEGTPLFARSQKRDGYFKVQPKDQVNLMRAILDASDMVGEFEKPIYVTTQDDLCAHSRSQKVGCTKCIDNCPTGAISPDGDVVSVDTDICDGCGNCAAHCPTGAIQYQYPELNDQISAIQTLASAYFDAGGKDPVLLIHDATHGMDLINASARFGDGLPTNVIPLEVFSPSSVGHVMMVAALSAGFSQIFILGNPRKLDEYDALKKEIELTKTIIKSFGFEDSRIVLAFENDPNVFESQLWDLPALPPLATSEFVALGQKREVARTAISLLANTRKTDIDLIPLSDDAPYGAVNVDTDKCTLCLACVSACPADALRDTEGKPELRFIESACVQCGVCRVTCPETAITLTPQLNLLPSAMQPVTLKEDEPFECIKCGTPFGARSTIERISEKLAGSHRMFESNKQAQLLKMCDNCRLETLAEGGDDPFAIAQRPAPRTTDDYLAAERDGLTIDDFLKKDD